MFVYLFGFLLHAMYATSEHMGSGGREADTLVEFN
jgi:hypothetical protein